jgi:chromosome segregation ATPase
VHAARQYARQGVASHAPLTPLPSQLENRQAELKDQGSKLATAEQDAMTLKGENSILKMQLEQQQSQINLLETQVPTSHRPDACEASSKACLPWFSCPRPSTLIR